jgi:hypothetical protein
LTIDPCHNENRKTNATPNSNPMGSDPTPSRGHMLGVEYVQSKDEVTKPCVCPFQTA